MKTKQKKKTPTKFVNVLENESFLIFEQQIREGTPYIHASFLPFY